MPIAGPLQQESAIGQQACCLLRGEQRRYLAFWHHESPELPLRLVNAVQYCCGSIIVSWEDNTRYL